MSNRETGERGEELALRHLEGEGYEALERNYRTRLVSGGGGWQESLG
ncbi:MAG TPA: hypothetical protein VKA51_13285 [Rubrobacteraceae bacterium]|nr:hypothetical protein [Rubrobacteraceae bacterium]